MAARSATGPFGNALRRLLMRRATVAECELIAPRFHLLTLEGPELRDVAWKPGQKLQIAMAARFASRTYTPIDWDASAGRTRILCYAHADGPGSAWARDSRPGDTCDILGPRSSIDLRPSAQPIAVFGDETSIGLAYALAVQRPGQSVGCYFEFDDEQAGGSALQYLKLANATLFERRSDDAHVELMAATLPSLAAAGASFVLTGKAGTIQRLRQRLKQLGVPTARITTKAYWAPGKTGLD